MAHREEQIVERVAELLRANTSVQSQVFVGRELSLSEDEGLLPALSVIYDEDEPQADSTVTIERLMTVKVTGYATDPDEVRLRQKLSEFRSHLHTLLLTDHTLGLDFVSDCSEGSVSKPVIVLGALLCGAREYRWSVLYRLNRNSPD